MALDPLRSNLPSLVNGPDPAGVVAALEDALSLHPGDAELQAWMTVAMTRVGRPDRAMVHACRALRIGGMTGPALHAFVSAISFLDVPGHDPLVVNGLLALLRRDDVDRDALAIIGVRTLRHDPVIGPMLSSGIVDGPQDALRLQQSRLLCALLELAVIPDDRIEALLTSVRAHALLQPVPQARGFLESLALQCHANEFVFVETSDERVRLARTVQQLSHDDDPDRLLAALCYRHARSEPNLSSALARSSFQRLIRVHLEEPAEESLLARGIARVSVASLVSRAVRDQYEENPYPRWHSLPEPEPSTLQQWLAERFPDEKFPALSPKHLSVLVAGCGTGRHAMLVAKRFPDAHVLGLDLSIASLAHARRHALARHIDNLDLQQADLLTLGQLRPCFHAIESVGVIHHLERPEDGLRALTHVLIAGGALCLGVYSRAARVGVIGGRKLMSQWGLRATPDDIREGRRRIRELSDDHPARRLTWSPDFHSMSGCRDLLFHAQEHQFDLPSLAAMIDRCGLDLVGFEPPSAYAAAAYDARFPGDRSRANVQHWAQMESDDPDLFAGMYVVWCRKRRAS